LAIIVINHAILASITLFGALLVSQVAIVLS